MKRTTIDELPRWARSLLEEARVARLGLVDDRGGPRVLPVTFALHDGRLWTAVDRKPKREPGREPARVRYLRSRPRAAITVDRYEDDWTRLAWVQVLGPVAIVEISAAPAALAALSAKYVQYVKETPPGPLLCLTPARALCWTAGRE